MSQLYNQFLSELSDAEREFYIEQEVINNDIEKACALLEMVEIKSEQMKKDAELKVLVESGTYDDLTFLYTEAREVAEQEEKGVLQALWDAIVRMFQSIKNFLFGKGRTVSPDSEAEIPSKFGSLMQQLTSAAGSENGNGKGILKFLGLVLSVTSGVFFAQDRYVKAKYKDVESWWNKVTSGIATIGTKIKQFGSESPILNTIKNWAITQKAMQVGGNIGHFISNLFKKFKEFIQTHILDKFKKSNSDSNESNNNTATDNSTATDGYTNDTMQQNNRQPRNLKQNLKINAFRARAAQTEQTDGSFTYRLSGNKLLRKVSNAPGAVYEPMSDRDVQNLPKHIRRTFGFESADDVIDLSDMRAELGVNYEVTLVDDETVDISFIGENANDDFIASYFTENEEQISIHQSIFGTNPEDEDTIEESTEDLSFDEELDQLSALFENM